jgi:organic radical activating enzyme
MSRIVGQTQSYCHDCQSTHEARYIVESDQVWYVIDCPREVKRTLVSSDASVYEDIRHKADFSDVSKLSFELRRPMAFMEITNACNFDCPVCYAQSGTHGQDHLTLDEIRNRLGHLRKAGVRWVTLTGGDPTMHPQLEQIIGITRREYGMRPILITNGLRLAEEQGFARSLKRAGLRKVQLQFDTFSNETYRYLRGRKDVQEKFEAVANVRDAGLRLGFVTTVSQENLPELGAILSYAASLSPTLNSMFFQSVVTVGRYPANIQTIDRETMIRSLVEQSDKHDLMTTDFWPTPPIPVWGMAVHPDCPVNLHLLVQAGKAHAIGRNVDLPLFFKAIRHAGESGNRLAALQPLIQLFRHARRGRRVSLLRHLYGLAKGRGARGMMWVSVGGYMNAASRDDQRLERCPGCTVTAAGVAGVCERSCNDDVRPLVNLEVAS